MTYLGYFEVIEGSGWIISDNLQELKDTWCFTMRIFKAPCLTQEDLDRWEKPRYKSIKLLYKIIHSEGELMHEKE